MIPKIIHSSWKLEFLFNDPRMEELKKEIKNSKTYPKMKEIFKAFSLPIGDVKVIMVGVAPYNTGQHNGLGFGVNDNKHTEELKMIRDCLWQSHMHRFDIDDPEVFDFTMENWMRQGILMLNLSLTSGTKRLKYLSRWKWFIEGIIKLISEYNTGLIFVFLGNNAAELINKIQNPEHQHILNYPYPTNPLFEQSDIFTKIDSILKRKYNETINWLIK